eukprot:SAG31_NODE_9705_length_1239_cov_9.896491_1_plen_89_part_00
MRGAAALGCAPAVRAAAGLRLLPDAADAPRRAAPLFYCALGQLGTKFTSPYERVHVAGTAVRYGYMYIAPAIYFSITLTRGMVVMVIA